MQNLSRLARYRTEKKTALRQGDLESGCLTGPLRHHAKPEAGSVRHATSETAVFSHFTVFTAIPQAACLSEQKTLRILILKPSQIDRSIRGRCAFRDREYAGGHSTERKAQMRPGGS